MDRYKIVRPIGQGKFGHVWLIKCLSNKKQYVLKQINLQYALKREQRAAHLEAKLLSTLKHPNIVSYLDSFYCSNGSLFIIMGYCECGDLYTYIRNRNGSYFEEKQIIHWLVQICMALKYIHNKNILHRDLKTQNIFLTRTKLIKVGDFGIARVLDGTKDMATTLIGTPYYMSPEVFCNKPYNQKSDVWSLGCCTYEIATLKHAFNACDISSLMQKILKGKVSEIPSIYSKEFLSIISSMLTLDPEQRPSVTDILLNTYVKKHIVLFLEETQSCVKASQKENTVILSAKTAVSQGKKASYQFVNKAEQTEISSVCCNKKNDAVKAKTVPVIVPDINGNGDGNDNSQQRCFICNLSAENCYSFPENCNQNSIESNGSLIEMTPCYTSKLKVKNLCAKHSSKSFKENINPEVASNLIKLNEFHIAENIKNYRSCIRSEPAGRNCREVNRLKNNGQKHLDFLSTLTYTISEARNAYFKSINGIIYHNNERLTQSSNSHIMPVDNERIRTSQTDCSARSKRRQALNKMQQFPHVSSGYVLNKSAKKVEIFKCPNIYSSNCSNTNSCDSVNVKCRSSCSNVNVTYNSVLPELNEHMLPFLKTNTQDFNVDKCLLQKIINLNMELCPVNLDARQRRRKKLEQDLRHALTKSEPAMFSVNCNE